MFLDIALKDRNLMCFQQLTVATGLVPVSSNKTDSRRKCCGGETIGGEKQWFTLETQSLDL